VPSGARPMRRLTRARRAQARTRRAHRFLCAAAAGARAADHESRAGRRRANGQYAAGSAAIDPEGRRESQGPCASRAAFDRENGHSVPMTVRVDSPMSEEDHVRRIDLVSEKNPVPLMATFFSRSAHGSRRDRVARPPERHPAGDGGRAVFRRQLLVRRRGHLVNESACLDGG